MENVKLLDDEEKILNIIKENPRGILVKEISEKTDMSTTKVGKHVHLLERLGYIETKTISKAILSYPK